MPPSSALRFATSARLITPRLIVPALASMLLLAGHHTASAADNTFVIADTEGYGIMDCLTDGKSCGRVVADAWCEAHGLGPARTFGRASDITGAVPVSASTTPTQLPRDAVVVACAD